jgi:hypothetical protein
VCKQPGPSGFFDREKYRTTIGFAYAGSSLAGLATHALANILFQSLAGAAESLPPGLDQLAEAVSQIGLQYMREVGILGGDKALFQGIVFGFCGRENRFRAFKITPNLDQDVHVDVSEQNLDRPEHLIAIGSCADLLCERVKADRPLLYADCLDAKMKELREIDLPKRALQKLIDEKIDDRIGGGLQYGWGTSAGFEPASHMIGLAAPLPSGRNAALTVLGFDITELGVGDYRCSVPGR